MTQKKTAHTVPSAQFMVRLSIILLILIFCCQCRVQTIKLDTTIDRDIVLVNIEEGDRAFIANIIQTLDSCQPAVIAIDVMFMNEKDPVKDSVLMTALKNTRNDILIYWPGKKGNPDHSIPKFTSFATDEGFMVFGQENGFVTRMTPVHSINNEIHELLPLKIIRHWKPQFKHSFKTNETVPIDYTRTLEQYWHFSGELVQELDFESLRNKVILVGYTGPGEEAKFFTPLRPFIKDHPKDKPDTYGIVIIANAIRTILKYEKKD